MRPGLGYLERLRILEKREEAWAMLNFRRSVQVSAPLDPSSGAFGFTGGAFLFGKRSSCADRATVGYSYVSLPSPSDAQDQKLEWKGLSLGTRLLDVELAVHEHDLIAALTACVFSFLVLFVASLTFQRSKEDADHLDMNMTLEIRLLSFSTGQPHPLAERPIIFIKESPLLDHCNVLIDIVGEFLALLITLPSARSESEDMFFLDDGKMVRFIV